MMKRCYLTYVYMLVLSYVFVLSGCVPSPALVPNSTPKSITSATYTLAPSATMSPSTSIPEARPTPTIISAVFTPVPSPNQINPTPTQSTDTSGCAVSSSRQRVSVTFRPAFCITWVDEYDDERGFRIILVYRNSDERFTYQLGPNTTQFIVPRSDAPRLNESREQCFRRKDFTVEIIALQSDGNQRVGGMAAEIECAPNLPTATPDARNCHHSPRTMLPR